jgi:hypothetical protein
VVIGRQRDLVRDIQAKNRRSQRRKSKAVAFAALANVATIFVVITPRAPGAGAAPLPGVVGDGVDIEGVGTLVATVEGIEPTLDARAIESVPVRVRPTDHAAAEALELVPGLTLSVSLRIEP